MNAMHPEIVAQRLIDAGILIEQEEPRGELTIGPWESISEEEYRAALDEAIDEAIDDDQPE